MLILKQENHKILENIEAAEKHREESETKNKRISKKLFKIAKLKQKIILSQAQRKNDLKILT